MKRNLMFLAIMVAGLELTPNSNTGPLVAFGVCLALSWALALYDVMSRFVRILRGGEP